ncbi:MAG: hypothetical protein AAF944_04665 [Bacteroidota bacterium]
MNSKDKLKLLEEIAATEAFSESVFIFDEQGNHWPVNQPEHIITREQIVANVKADQPLFFLPDNGRSVDSAT